MLSAVVLKKRLKEFRDSQKQLLQKNLKEKEELSEKIKEIIKEMDSNALLIMQKVLSNKEDENWLDTISTLNSSVTILVKRILELDDRVQKLEEGISYANHLIQIYDNDKAKKEVISLSNLLFDLKFCHIVLQLPLEVISECFGMVVFYNNQLINHSKNSPLMESQDIVKILGAFYNSNGTFTNNSDIATFTDAILHLENNDLELVSEIPFTISTCKLALKFQELLKKSNKTSEAIIQSAEPKTEKKSLDYEAISYVQRYYRNGELKDLPDNIKEFQAMLKRCSYTLAEQRTILRLLEEKLKSQKAALKLTYLSDTEQELYEKARNLNLSYLDANYYPLLSLLDNLQVLLDMYLEYKTEEEVQMLDASKREIMEGLRKICFENEPIAEAEVQNNLGFLMMDEVKSYASLDLKSLDPGVRPLALSLLQNHLSDSNRNRFQKVKLSSNLFQVYEIFNSRANIFFLEIVKGVYVVLGVNVAGQGYREINRRIMKYEKILMQLKENLQDETYKAAYLETNALIFEKLIEENTKTRETKNK